MKYVLAQLCNGLNSTKAIEVDLARFLPRVDARRLLNILDREGVSVDGKDISGFLTMMANNPNPWSPEMSEREISALVREAIALEEAPQVLVPNISDSLQLSIIAARRSVRSFNGIALSADELAGVLWAAYGLTAR